MTSPGQTVFMTGATGLVGRRVCEGLGESGTSIRALSRRPPSVAVGGASIEWIQGDVCRPESWAMALEGVDAVVHLAGEPIAGKRWTEARKKQLVMSRVEGTRNLVAAIAGASDPPPVLVCASAAGYYGPRGEEVLDETSGPGTDFLARLCVAWEGEAEAATRSGVRVVRLRFGSVLSQQGGALSAMLPLFRLGLGGPLGGGERFFPWIHELDAAALVRWSLEPGRPEGAINAVAPQVVRMAAFATELGAALGRPARLPVPRWLLRIALGEMGGFLTPGQQVTPTVTSQWGYGFLYPELGPALRSLLG